MGSIREHISKDGKKTFHAYVRVKGHPTEYSKHTDRRSAERWVKKIESAIYDGLHTPSHEAKKHTLKEAIERYRKEVLPEKPRNAKNISTHLAWWEARLGGHALSSLTPALVSKAKDELAAKEENGKSLSPATVNRYLASLSHLLSVARKEWHWINDSPLTKVTRKREPRGRLRFLSDEERKRLLEACEASPDRNLYPVVLVALGTGMRLGEITGLTWDRVDLEKGVIILDETKNGDRRRVSIAGVPLEGLKAHAKVRRLDSQLVFPKIEKGRALAIPHNIRPAWEAACSDANLQDFRFHDLRHTFASYMAMNGANLIELSELLGHKTVQMVKRYAHLSESHTAKLVENMSRKVFG